MRAADAERMDTVHYRDWVTGNTKLVQQASNGLIGYVHIPDMEGRGYAEIVRHLNAASR